LRHKFKVSRGAGKIARFETQLVDSAFSSHRHDYYTLALTVQGVQSFNYRGEQRVSTPGSVIVLHPDEKHDGKTVTDKGFCYRSLNIEPYQLQHYLGGNTLPFIEGGISNHSQLLRPLKYLLSNITSSLEPLEFESVIHNVYDALCVVGKFKQSKIQSNYQAVLLARQYLLDNWQNPVTMDELEQITSYDRLKLARDFRKILGTSPYRFVILRRLEHAQNLLLKNKPLADIALECAFSDQSHFTRQFKQAFGFTPKTWKLALH